MKFSDLSYSEQSLLRNPPQPRGTWTTGALTELLSKGLLRIKDVRRREIHYTETTCDLERTEAGNDLLATE